ncbi:zinc finger protein [Cinnamomum micranthum f. kanehirae]|uniref:Zinc finger protein n=1 Tax=Cinnamomum micranthum f. kanehirae TaxID=337451 RepID=A0A443PXB2_9MAGN|nr:zinc finger protein [Cinnamomum micranthum f. kanehirae]
MEAESNTIGITNCSSSDSNKDSNPCPICLRSIHEDAYLDRCFHKFCYDCIAHWAKLVASKHRSSSKSSLLCPLCKGENFSIIHGCDGHSYQQHFISQDLEKGFSISEAHRYRLQCYYCVPGSIYEKFNILQYWKFRRYLQPNKWLQDWLKREIQALIQVEDVDIIVHHVHGVVESKREHSKDSPEQKREQFRALLADAVGPFVFGRSERLVNELELFLVSGLNIEAYDKVYLQCFGGDTLGATSGPAEDNHERTSEVPYLRLFDEDIDDRTD